MLNTRFKIDDERITVDNSGIGFDSFTIRDTLNSTAVLNGKAYTTDFLNYQFDLNLTSDNFKALSSTKKQNSLYYGDLFITTDLSILGTNEEPQVDGSIKVNKGTKLSVVLPQAEPGLIEREGVVQFVDYSAMGNDSIFLLAYDSLNTSPLIGFDISTNIEIDKEAEFNLILDEGNGDFLNVKGEANLTAGIDPSGKITMTGSYELVQGSYELSFNFLRRKFDIEKGSRIVWRGEPTNAELDVRAIYEVNIAPLDLVSNQLEGAEGAALNIYRQKLPFQVILNLRGDLMKPEITFDIQLKEGNYGVAKDIVANVETKLAQIKNEPAELNKQAFAILLLNRFVSENPFDNSGGGLDAATFARQSASKLLTEQLNRLAAGLLEDVDINFDLASSEDFTTGERRQRTDFNVALSKQLLNDRLKVTVGSNFELEGPRKSNSQGSNFAGNLALDYSLTQDSRYLLRFYRKNEYQGILEGYVVETGINFIMTLDYNRFREIFKSIIKGREERKRKKAAKKDAKAEPKIETNEQLIQPQAKDSVNGN
ncbi:MAG: translocation/assembly module TamB domain-containing protein [Chitinophagaceae bacterium]